MARVSDVELQRLKRDVSLARLCEAKGLALEKRGPDNFVGRCPFHEDATPSFVVSPKKNVFHCLGCGAGGSVIDFVMRAEGVSFRHAVELLRNDAPLSATKPGEVKASSVRRLPAPVDAGADDGALLDQVADYYHQTLQASAEAKAYLEKRGLADEALVAHFRLGYANRTLGLRLPESNRVDGAKLRGRLQQLGVYRESGHEHLAGSLVVPLTDEAGAVVGLYGRKVTPNLRAGTPNHLYLPGPHRCAFNVAGLAEGKGVAIVCEAVLDALAFWAAGFRYVTAAYGAGGFTPHHLEALKRHQVKDVFLAFDRDDAGDEGAQQLSVQLQAQGFDCYRVEFPRGMDANEYALKVQPAAKSLGHALRHATFMGSGTPRRHQHPFLPLSPLSAGPAATPPADALPEGREEGKRVAVTTAAKDTTVASSPVAVPGHGAAVAAPTPAPAGAGAHQLPRKSGLPTGDGEIHEASGSSTSSIAEPAPSRAPPMMATTSTVANTAPGLTDDEGHFNFGPRRYRLRGLAKQHPPDSLRLNVLLSVGEAFHVDTLDLYSAKARVAFVLAAAAECSVDADAVKRDVGLLLLQVEALLDKRREEARGPKAPTLTEDERAAALDLLRTPELLARVLEDFGRCGVVGEETNKLVGYLAAVSRKLDEPLAVLIQSSSAAGKSSLMEAVLAFVPEEEKTKYSAMTGQSLFYMGDVSLRHKVLAVVEEEGATRASYALKLLQSEGELTIASTGKDPHTGRLVTHEYRVEGPTQLFLTTTAAELDEELLNRCLVLSVDEDRAQTRAIHQQQREKQTLEGLLARRQREATLKLHQNAQRLLRPLAVVNPYARQLTFLDDRTRARRDFPKYLALIRAIALLHQYQRPVKTVAHAGGTVEYVEVTAEDIATANRLAAAVLGRTLDELPPQTRRLLAQLEAYVTRRATDEACPRSAVVFTRRQLREAVGGRNSQLALHLGRLADFEYVRPRKTAHGAYAYTLAQDEDVPAPSVAGLADVATLGAAAPTPTNTTAQLPGPAPSFRPPSGVLPAPASGSCSAQSPRPFLSLAASPPASGLSAKAHSAGSGRVEVVLAAGGLGEGVGP
jgi:DNA primase catalytic core